MHITYIKEVILLLQDNSKTKERAQEGYMSLLPFKKGQICPMAIIVTTFIREK